MVVGDTGEDDALCPLYLCWPSISFKWWSSSAIPFQSIRSLVFGFQKIEFHTCYFVFFLSFFSWMLPFFDLLLWIVFPFHFGFCCPCSVFVRNRMKDERKREREKERVWRSWNRFQCRIQNTNSHNVCGHLNDDDSECGAVRRRYGMVVVPRMPFTKCPSYISQAEASAQTFGDNKKVNKKNVGSETSMRRKTTWARVASRLATGVVDVVPVIIEQCVFCISYPSENAIIFHTQSHSLYIYWRRTSRSRCCRRRCSNAVDGRQCQRKKNNEMAVNWQCHILFHSNRTRC